MKNMNLKRNLSMKDGIAMAVTLVSLGFIIMISIFTMCHDCKDGLDFIAKSVLPLVGTWMGVILAFYYSKENFQAASDSVQKMADKIGNIKEKLQGLKAIEAMISFSDIKTIDKVMTMTIQETINFLKTNKIQRLPVIENGVVKNVIHQSTLAGYISSKVLSANQTMDELKKLTVGKMFENPEDDLKNYLTKGIEFVSSNATLYDVWSKMQNNKYCQDVFITRNGNNNETILGCITDNIVREKAEM